MRDIHRYVTENHTANWNDIGLELGLPFDTLKTIRINHPHQVEDCFEDVLDRWLTSNPSATWRTLEVALTNVRRQQLGLNPIDDVHSGEIL